MRAHLRPLLLAAALFSTAAAPAFADDGWIDGVEVMAEDDMADLRGGLAITPNINVNFGAVVTTFVNGMPALMTNITWTEAGQIVNETVGNIGESIDALTPEQRQDLGIDGLEGAGGIVIDDADGVTALVHNVTEGALQNIIINSAAGRDLRQEVDVTLTLPGFEAVQQSLLEERLGIRLADDLSAASFGH